MNGVRRGVCVLALGLVLLLGCKSLDLDLALTSDSAGRTRIVSGSVEGVARSTQLVLQEMGLEATSTRDGDAIRLRSRTNRGQKFDVVITRSAEGKALVRIEWEGTADDGVGMSLLATLGAATER